MKINLINKTSFQSQENSKSFQKILSRNPKTADEANEYILNVDRIAQAIPGIVWDGIYAMSESDKINLSNYLKASYLTKSFYDPDEFVHPQKLYPKIKKVLRYNHILDGEEIKRFIKKTQGAYNPKDVLSPSLLLTDPELDAPLNDNLKFIKTLMKEENNEILKLMSPVTATKILFNKFLKYEDFKNSLNALKEDDTLNLSPLDGFETSYYKLRNQRETIHEYLLGESYKKIADADDRLEKSKSMRIVKKLDNDIIVVLPKKQ